MTNLRNDLRLGIRRLLRQPVFAIVAILTLALGLGANVAIFTLVHALMLRSLPVQRPGELYRLGDSGDCCVNSGLAGDTALFSVRLFEHLRDNLPEFSNLAGFQAFTPAIGVRRQSGVAESLPSEFVTGNYFETFGVRPAIGRLLAADDDRPGAPPAVVLSYRTWADRFGGDSALVGESVLVNGTPMTVVGVTGEAFFGDTIRPDPTGIWMPLGQEPAVRGASSLTDRPAENWLYAIGRLRPGAQPEEVQTRASNMLRQWLSAQAFLTSEDRTHLAEQRIPVVPAGGGVALMRLQFSNALMILFATSGLVLLIAAANLANLLLARADRGQAAIRAALGASTSRLMRQALTEGLLLSIAGGLAALVVATLATRALISLTFAQARFVPVDAAPSPMVLLFAMGLALVTGALFTTAPAWVMSRTPPLDALTGVGRSGHHRSLVPRRALVVGQVALSVVLLAGAGLLARSLGNLEHQRLGFEPDDRLVAQIDPPALAGQADRLSQIYARIQDDLRQIPGVANASYSLYSPMEGNNWSSGITIAGRPVDPANRIGSSWNRVGPGYFATVGTPVLRGRAIDARDAAGAQRVAVVNQAFVRRFFDAGDPIGQQLGIGSDASHSGDYTIVGVVDDVKYTAASQPVRPMIFLPAFQSVTYADPSDSSAQARSMLLRSIVVQARPGASGLEGAVRQALASVDPNLTVVRMRPMDVQIGANFRLNRLMARLASVYGLLALALAALGLYGVTAHGVSTRTREIGVRMALGADRRRIMRTVVRGPIVQTAIGLAIGIPLALLGGRAIAAQLYDVGTGDPFTFGGVTIALLASAVVAAALPARRAASVNPTQALRGE
jgi:predicted permease